MIVFHRDFIDFTGKFYTTIGKILLNLESNFQLPQRYFSSSSTIPLLPTKKGER